MAPGRARVAALRQDDRYRLTCDKLRLVQRLRGLAFHDLGTAFVTVSFCVLEDFLLEERLEPRRALQCLLQQVALFIKFVLLAADLHLLELGEIAQPQIEDGFGLEIREFEALHQHWFRFVLGADDLYDLIDVEVGDKQSVQDVQSIGDNLQTMLQAPLHGLAPELEPLLQHIQEVEHPRPALEVDNVHVDAHRALERRRREQVRHQLFDIDAPFLADYEPDRFLVVRFIAKVVHLWELLRAHLHRNLLEHLAAGYLVRQRRNDDVAVFDLVGSP